MTQAAAPLGKSPLEREKEEKVMDSAGEMRSNEGNCKFTAGPG